MKEKILFLSYGDPQNIKAWSGIKYHLYNKLSEEYMIDSLFINRRIYKLIRIFFKMKYNLKSKFVDYKYRIYNDVLFCKVIARFLDKRIKKNYKFIFAPAMTSVIGYLKTDIPIIYFNDATFEKMMDYYPGYGDLGEKAINDANEIEKRAMNKAELSIFTSLWALESAKNFYHIDEKKLKILHFGANIRENPSIDKVKKSWQEKEKNKKMKLLFVGKEWERKGGDIAYKITKKLNENGIDTKLTVCGCIPPKEYHDKYVEVIPFLNKKIPEDKEKFDKLFYSSHFFILPTRAECAGIVFCEAMAYGVPSVSTSTGGVGDYVINKSNGIVIDSSLNIDEAANQIAQLFNNEEEYKKLAVNSRKLFEQKYNWDVWLREFKKMINSLGEIDENEL